jgi:hypothetical protein
LLSPGVQHPFKSRCFTLLPQALCFDSEEDMLAALEKDTEKFRGKVVVIRCDYAPYVIPLPDETIDDSSSPANLSMTVHLRTACLSECSFSTP